MSEKNYKISVIIPVYNCAEYIEPCTKSLMSQSMPATDFQIVFVNDGSADDSGKICKELAQKHPNITYFEKENGGVSSARNKGIELATGKYIMFLDSDDTLSSNCLKSIYNFFEANYDEIDIVTYSINYLHEDGSVTTNKRFNVLSHTGVYDINSDPNILQTTMNVCVKNVAASERILFNENLTLGEDQWFIFSWLLKKQKLGFVKEAVYIYYRHAGSASQIFNNPYYCFDQYTGFLRLLLDACRDQNGKPHPTAQALVVYNFGWRLTADQLVCHVNEATEHRQLEVLRDILAEVDDRIISTSIYIDPYHTEYLMNLKGVNCGVALNDSTVSAHSGDVLVFSQALAVSFGVFRVSGSKCIVSGYLKNCFVPLDRIKFYCATGNGGADLKEIKLRETAFSYYKGKLKSNCFGGFDFAFDLKEFNCVSFKAKVGNMLISPVLQFGFKCSVNANKPFAACGGYTVEFLQKSKCIVIIKADEKRLANARAAADTSVAAENKRALVYRTLNKYAKKGRHIWLYCDREGLVDNAYYQFIHDFGKNDGVERYYVTDDLDPKQKLFTSKQKKHLVKFRSLKHKMLFLSCDKILTTFNSLSIFSPFGGAPLKWYSDLTHYDVIYLQHGILHASLPLLYSKEKAHVDKVVISSKFEQKSFVENYNFSEADLIMSGMPRLDAAGEIHEAKNRILFSPSWRKSLIGEYVHNTRQLMDRRFLNSTFYKQIMSFLNSKELADLLEQYDLYLDFNNHPIFKDYDKHFTVDNPRITVTQKKRDIQDYLVMITDYSSFVFDFVYLSRPVLYFVPDYDEFKAGITHNYSKLDLPLEEGFGTITSTGDELISALESLAQNEFKAQEPYKTRMDSFFENREPNHADKLYDALIIKD